MAASYIGDDYSRHFYIRKDLLLKFLRKYNLMLVWHEIGTRYGNVGKSKKELNPSFKDFCSVEQMGGVLYKEGD
jgi:hypothetical protein